MIVSSLNQIKATSSCFVYGTLMSERVVSTLIGREPTFHKPAFLPPNKYSRHPVIGQRYPGVIETGCNETENFMETCPSMEQLQSSSVEGMLITGLTDNEMKIFDYFEDEGVDYVRKNTPIFLKNGDEIKKVETQVYIWNAGNDLLDLERSWDFHHFQSENLSNYIKYVVKPCRMDLDRLGL